MFHKVANIIVRIVSLHLQRPQHPEDLTIEATTAQ